MLFPSVSFLSLTSFLLLTIIVIALSLFKSFCYTKKKRKHSGRKGPHMNFSHKGIQNRKHQLESAATHRLHKLQLMGIRLTLIGLIFIAFLLEVS